MLLRLTRVMVGVQPDCKPPILGGLKPGVGTGVGQRGFSLPDKISPRPDFCWTIFARYDQPAAGVI